MSVELKMENKDKHLMLILVLANTAQGSKPDWSKLCADARTNLKTTDNWAEVEERVRRKSHYDESEKAMLVDWQPMAVLSINTFTYLDFCFKKVCCIKTANKVTFSAMVITSIYACHY